MINIKDHHTEWLFDPWDHLGPKRRKLLDKSWAGVFRTYLLEKLPIEKISRYFDESQGRPTKELYTAMGMLILQQLHDLSDPDVTMTLAFNEQWHYALDITDSSHALQPAIDETTERDCRPEELLCDSHYGSDDNVQKAASKEVEVIAPIQGNPHMRDTTLADFEIDPATHFVISCPEDVSPPKRLSHTQKQAASQI